MNEQQLIERLRELFPPGKGVLVGIGDDAALLESPARLSITKDLLVEGSHFTRNHPPFFLGRKAVNVNVSDLAAVGAEPLWIFLGLSFPAELADSWLDEFLEGVRSACQEAGCSLAGGDLSASSTVFISITAAGKVENFVERGKCSPGDQIVLSGRLGLARAGLELFLAEEEGWPELLSAFLDPLPQLAASRKLAPVATSMIDVSDGFVIDLWRLLGGRGAEIDYLPVDQELERYCSLRGKDPLEYVLYGGEDYALIATVARGKEIPPGVERIGTVKEGGGIEVMGRRVEVRGFDHFKEGR